MLYGWSFDLLNARPGIAALFLYNLPEIKINSYTADLTKNVKNVWNVGKVGKVGKVETVGEVGKVGKVRISG